jgi:hypothetical protein
MSDLPQTNRAACVVAFHRGAPAGLPRGAGRAGVAAVQGGRRGGRWGSRGCAPEDAKSALEFLSARRC